jgi:hypothetical protein
VNVERGDFGLRRGGSWGRRSFAGRSPPKTDQNVSCRLPAVVLEAERGTLLDERLDCRIRVTNASRPVPVRCSRKGWAAQIVAAVQVHVGLRQQRAKGSVRTIAADPSSRATPYQVGQQSLAENQKPD